jgi:hypothetical protein
LKFIEKYLPHYIIVENRLDECRLCLVDVKEAIKEHHGTDTLVLSESPTGADMFEVEEILDKG